MRNDKKRMGKYYLFGILVALILISTVSAISQSGTRTFLSGNDCLEAHSGIYIRNEMKINYEGHADIGEELIFEISFISDQPGNIFSARSEIIFENPNITLHDGQPSQSKLVRTDETFIASWSLSGKHEGNYTFEIQTRLTVQYIRAHPVYVATYEYSHLGAFSVLDGSDIPPSVIFSDDPPNSGENLTGESNLNKKIGQILGFISIVSVYFSIQLGMPKRKQAIRKEMEWTGAKLRQAHCNWSYFSIAAIGLHLIFLSQTKSWGNYFHWYEIYPKFLSLRMDWISLFIGLDVAALSGVIFVISAITGQLFKKIAQKHSYRFAVLTQQISYGALIFAVLHAILNGTWTLDFVLLAVIQIFLVFEVLISRLLIFIKKKSNMHKSKEHIRSEK